MKKAARKLLYQARSRARRRREPDGPWYDKPQSDLPQELRELQRLYWRLMKRRQRGDVLGAVATRKLLDVMPFLRSKRRNLREIRSLVHYLTRVSQPR